MPTSRTPNISRTARHPNGRMTYGASGTGRQWVLDVPFAERSAAQAAGAEWNQKHRCHLYIGDELPAGLARYEARLYSWEKWKEDDLNGTVTTSKATRQTMTPRQHQLDGAQAAVTAFDSGYPGFLLADDVGCGKTVSTVVAAMEIAGRGRIPKQRNILIVCPKAVIPHWRRTLEAVGDGGNRICIINYERLKNLLSVPPSASKAKKTRTKNKRIAAHGKSLVDWDIVIGDETQRLCNPQAQRTVAFNRVARGTGNGPGAFVMYLSATAGTTPLDLSYLAPVLAKVTGDNVRDLAEFETWCASQGIQVRKGMYGRWEWEPNDADLELMRSLLFDGATPAGLRRRPQEIADWPEVVRSLTPVELSFEQHGLYDDAWTEFRRALKLEQRGKNSNGLGALTRFRQKASLLRTDATVDHVLDLLDNGMQVAVSTVWLESLEAIANQLDAKGIPVAVIHGQQDENERESERIAFQQGDCRVCVFTVAEGISLHAGEEAVNGSDTPRATVVHDVRWSARDMLQIEGRCHRDGQFAAVYVMFAEDTIEDRIATRMVERLISTKQIVGDDVESVKAIQDEMFGLALADE